MNGLTQLLSNVDKLQLRKVEDIIPDSDILRDTYIIYPDGGYHPFYGMPNTLPRYQQKIWPYVERIKFDIKWSSKEKRDNIRKKWLRENHTIEQINPYWDKGYYFIMMRKTGYYTRNRYPTTKNNGKHSQHRERGSKKASVHRLVALAFIPNPENKPQVMHVNDDPTNYLIENLKWGTQRENMRGKTPKRPDTMEQKYLNLVNRGIIKG